MTKSARSGSLTHQVFSEKRTSEGVGKVACGSAQAWHTFFAPSSCAPILIGLDTYITYVGHITSSTLSSTCLSWPYHAQAGFIQLHPPLCITLTHALHCRLMELKLCSWVKEREGKLLLQALEHAYKIHLMPLMLCNALASCMKQRVQGESIKSLSSKLHRLN